MNTRFAIKNIEPVESLHMVITFGDGATMSDFVEDVGNIYVG